MMKLKNTLYLLDENFYIHAMNNNIVIKKFGQIINRIPIHIIDSILCFNYMGVTPDVFKLCNINNVTLTFLSPSGSFMGHLVGESHGNVYLRREQYRIADDKPRAIKYARNMIFGKICNQKYVLDSFISKNKKSCDQKFEKTIEKLTESLKLVLELEDFESLRGVEGDAARAYFSVFDQMILKDKENFYFNGRDKRPPKDRVNALLSYGYALLNTSVKSALESIGLDSYVGFFHTDRPGRASLALDMMEEFRPILVDRFILNLINLEQIKKKDLVIKESGAVLLNDDAKRNFLKLWNERKHNEIFHPFAEENIKIGLLPFIQAQQLSRTIRNEIDLYPPFILKVGG